MHKLSSDHHIYYFEPHAKPALRVSPGERVLLEIEDALSGQVTEEYARLSPAERDPIDQEQANPATGPIFISDAEPGDAVAVHINRIETLGRGFASVGNGALRGKIKEPLIRFFDSDRDDIEFCTGITIPRCPMVGVIGVAPLNDRISTRYPGDHGGNMDANLIREGTTVYLPVFAPGALLALGDVHAVMGDGEVNGQGIETRAMVEIQVGVLKRRGLKRPLIETDEVWATIACHEDLEEAAWLAVEDMTEFLQKQMHISASEAFLLTGLTGDIRICQMVVPLRTVRVEIPKKVMQGVQ